MTTTLDAPRFGSNEAAQGARKARLAEIDIAYRAMRATFETEHQQAWDAAIEASCERIRHITHGMTIAADWAMQHESRLRTYLARPKLLTEALEMQERLSRLTRIHLLNLTEIDERWEKARQPYDFDVPLIAVPAQREDATPVDITAPSKPSKEN